MGWYLLWIIQFSVCLDGLYLWVALSDRCLLSLFRNFSIRFMPIPIIDASQALKANPEKTEDALLKVICYLLWFVSLVSFFLFSYCLKNTPLIQLMLPWKKVELNKRTYNKERHICGISGRDFVFPHRLKVTCTGTMKPGNTSRSRPIGCSRASLPRRHNRWVSTNTQTQSESMSSPLNHVSHFQFIFDLNINC